MLRTGASLGHHESGPVEDVGRVGSLMLQYVRQGDRTILSNFRSRSPWHFFPPISLDDTACAYTSLVNPSGGLVGGDRLSIQATLEENAHVLFSTPSANRIYRSLSETSVQSVELTVGPGAIAEWIPEATIPFAGSRFHQTIHVRLKPGATVLLWDAIASGRIARNERWAFASLQNEVRISTSSGGSMVERYHLVPGEKGTGVGIVQEWDYVAALYLISSGVGTDALKRIEERIAVALDERPDLVLGGVSRPSVPGLVVKLVARSAVDLTVVLEALWKAMREELWGLPIPAIRRY
ncbi:MAG TPA: urease accessory protein UreD [Nitrospiraceae bacterium]|jgi:urease accessory protein|nr:urease accessory protein UreD [Nitrospiraceae bacterium]